MVTCDEKMASQPRERPSSISAVVISPAIVRRRQMRTLHRATMAPTAASSALQRLVSRTPSEVESLPSALLLLLVLGLGDRLCLLK